MNPLVTVLAAKRLTQLVVDDEITSPIRDRVIAWGDAHPENSLPERLSYLASCPACVSVYAGALILLASRHPAGRAITRVLAASASVLLLEAVVGRLER